MQISSPRRMPVPQRPLERSVLARLQSEQRISAPSLLGYTRQLDAEAAYRRLSQERSVRISAPNGLSEEVDSLQELLEVDSFLPGGRNHVLPEEEYEALCSLANSGVLVAEGRPVEALEAYRSIKQGRTITFHDTRVGDFRDLIAVESVNQQITVGQDNIEIKMDEGFLMVGGTLLELGD